MAGILVKTTSELKEIKDLVSKEIPNYRQAYSDRTAFIMACLSELSYLKFNEPFFKKDDKTGNIISSLLDGENLKTFKKLYDVFGYDHKEKIKKLKNELEVLNIELKETFDSNGTQAMIVSTKDFYTLVFRGTEIDDIKDIKADFSAKIRTCESGGKMHTGFYYAFSEVQNDVQDYLNTINDGKPLFITGHSLGGALAIVATKKLKYSKIAACYTFGSPRVANEAWTSGLKTPIYRLVNSADPVTMLPPSGDHITFASWLLKLIRLKGLSEKLRNYYGGYYHIGYMRFLTNIEKGNYKSTKLLYSVTFFRRIRAYLKKLSSLKNLPEDHSIVVYREKLKFIAINKNQKGEN